MSNDNAGREAWLKARLGKWTASRAPDLMDTLKSGEVGSRAHDYVAEVAFERISGNRKERFVTGAMRRGLELEPEIWAAYEMARGHDTEPSGLVVHPAYPNCAATPDRLVGSVGLVEGKAPENLSKHLASLAVEGEAFGDTLDKITDNAAAIEYADQAQWQLWCSPERQWCDVASFHPDFPPHLQIAITRVLPNPKRHAEFAERVRWAERQVGAIIAAMPDQARFSEYWEAA